ncbi:MAG TPA: hypothetical protein VEW26_09040 [Allosphingosinicella sp.]|nr:hypothetical protein [Allosphingosinicella sp.]
MRARALSTAVLAAAAAMSWPAGAQSGRISRMTPGYTYFNRAGADLAGHDSDLRECVAVASRMNAEERVRKDRGQAGLVGNLLESWIAGAAQRGIVAAAIENCMVVRGWRVVALDETLGRQWEALAPSELRAALAGQVGAEAPTGRPVRWWNNDAARASSNRFALRPPANGKQLGLRALLAGGAPAAAAAEPPSAEPIAQSWNALKRTVAREAWSSVPADRALVVVKMKGVGPSNGVTLSFQRMGEARGGHAQPAFMTFQHGLSGNRKEGRFYVFQVEPGRWRLDSIHALHLCLGAPAFDVAAGEVVYGGSFDLGSESLGPDLSLAEVRAFLAGHPISGRLRPAQYRNGFTETCAGIGSIYALEIPGAPFEPGYRGGSRAGDKAP